VVFGKKVESQSNFQRARLTSSIDGFANATSTTVFFVAFLAFSGAKAGKKCPAARV